jgi:hypothetical protein
VKKVYNIGDLITADFPWGRHELWIESRGYVSDAVRKGDCLLVLQVTDKRLKILTSGGLAGWIYRTILEQQ